MSSTVNSIGFSDQGLNGLTNIKSIDTVEFTVLSTTSSTAITSVGSQNITVASTANMAIDQMLRYDVGGANQEYVTITALTGTTFTAYFTKTHATGVTVDAKVQRQPVAIGDSATFGIWAAIVAKTLAGANALQVQPFVDSGRSLVTLASDGATTSATTESLVSFTVNNGGVQSTSSNYTVTTGKTLRIQSITFSAANVTGGLGANNTYSVCRMRFNASGAVTTSSQLRVSGVLGLSATNGGLLSLAPGGEMEIPSGATIGFSRQDAAASVLFMGVTIVGYEF